MCFFIGGDIFLSHLDICIMNGKTYSQGQTWYDLVWRMRQSACVMMERLATTDVVRGKYINYEDTKVINVTMLLFFSLQNFYYYRSLKCYKFDLFHS